MFGKCICGILFVEKEPHKLILKYLSKYSFVCKYNEDGCEDTFTQDRLINHEKICRY